MKSSVLLWHLWGRRPLWRWKASPQGWSCRHLIQPHRAPSPAFSLLPQTTRLGGGLDSSWWWAHVVFSSWRSLARPRPPPQSQNRSWTLLSSCLFLLLKNPSRQGSEHMLAAPLPLPGPLCVSSVLCAWAVEANLETEKREEGENRSRSWIKSRAFVF